MKAKVILTSICFYLFWSSCLLAQNHSVHFTGKIGHSFFDYNDDLDFYTSTSISKGNVSFDFNPFFEVGVLAGATINKQWRVAYGIKYISISKKYKKNIKRFSIIGQDTTYTGEWNIYHKQNIYLLALPISVQRKFNKTTIGLGIQGMILLSNKEEKSYEYFNSLGLEEPRDLIILSDEIGDYYFESSISISYLLTNQIIAHLEFNNNLNVLSEDKKNAYSFPSLRLALGVSYGIGKKKKIDASQSNY